GPPAGPRQDGEIRDQGQAARQGRPHGGGRLRSAERQDRHGGDGREVAVEAYFWTDSRYATRSLIRSRTSVSWSESRPLSRKVRPQTGMLPGPWPWISKRPSMMAAIRPSGKAPPLRSRMRVRSAGLTLSTSAIGPFPAAAAP